MHKTLRGLGAHLCDLHFPLPHPDGLLQVPIADLLPNVHHHLWSSELRQLLPELHVQSRALARSPGGEGTSETVGLLGSSSLLGLTGLATPLLSMLF